MQTETAPGGEALPWRIVWALSVTQIVSWGSLYYAISVLLPPIERESGWSRDAIIGAYSLSLLCAAIGAYPVGAWIDRRGGRAVMACGSLLAAALFACMSVTHSLVVFYLLWIGLGFTMAMVLYDPAFAVIAQAFGGSARKGMTALALAGGFASTVFWPFTQWLISTLGWRDSLLVLALCNLLICAPLHALYLPRSPRHRPADRTRALPSTSAPGMREVLATRTFWLLGIAFACNMLAFSALSVHIIPLLAEKGFTMADAVWVAAVIGPMQVAGRIGELSIGAKYGATQVGVVAFVLLPVALFFLNMSVSPWALLLLFVVPYGASNGIMTITRGVIPAEIFGRERYGAVNGALATPVAAARAAGPFMASAVWSAWGGYTAVVWVIAGIGVLSLAAFVIALASVARK